MKTIYLKVQGDYACFTRPEMKVERVSYDVMTPSAARGVLEAILWKPAIRWVVTRIDVLKPIRWFSVRRNEVADVVPAGSVKSAMKAGKGDLGLYVEDSRQQRAGLILRDVAYVIHAHFEMTNKAGEGDNPAKFTEMFERRTKKGQCMHRPYLGCREFAADFEWLDASQTITAWQPEADKDLGWMLHDLDYNSKEPQPRFFRAAMKAGSVLVPSFAGEEIRT